MRIYSIVRVGDAYVVRAGEKSVLKIASRRRAARTVSDAVELLQIHAALQSSQPTHKQPSSVRDPRDRT
jgi:hypothetical protein